MQSGVKVKKDTKSSVARPFLKWVGGKAKLIPQLAAHYPDSYGKFYEPFVGGGAMFFSLNPKDAHINDMNAVLINGYISIRDNTDKLVDELSALQEFYWKLPTLDLKKEFYLEKRAVFNDLKSDEFEKSVLLIFLNKTCFNGMYRENSKGGFNVPFGKHERPTICDEVNLRNVAKSLEQVSITQGSYEDAVKDAKKGDFVYFDPPYHPINTSSSFTAYQAGGFSAEDQEKLRDTFRALSQKGCKVMLSNSDTPLINELYKEFKIHKIYAARSINSVGSGRGKIAEVLVTNY